MHSERGSPGTFFDTWNIIHGLTDHERFVGPVGPSANVDDICPALA